jgi:PAS domain S-box-containing protein
MSWPPDDVRRIVDALADSIIVADSAATVVYANAAAATLLRRELHELIGKSFAELLAPESAAWSQSIEAAVTGGAHEALGLRHRMVFADPLGATIPVEFVGSVATTRMGWPVLIAVLRSDERSQLHRVTSFTEQMLGVLCASSSSNPADQLLSSLCRRLGWEVAALWGLRPDGSMICRGVWTAPEAPARAYVAEKQRNPTHDVGGLARMVIERGSPVWFTDLASLERFTSDAILEDGLTSACALPVRFGGQVLGAIKMMTRARREPDPDLIELVGAISGAVGAILHALEQAAERDALVEELEATKRRLEFILGANRAVSEAGGYVEAVDRLADVAVPTLADLCLIDVQHEDGSIRRLAARHADPRKAHLAAELLVNYAPNPHSRHPSADVMATGRSRWAATMSEEFLRETSQDEHHLQLLKELHFTSYMTVPLVIEDQVMGTVTLVSAGSGRRFTERELAGAEELAGQVASVLERARLLDTERQISHTLQQSLLPERLPSIPGLDLSAIYLPAAEDVEVGGDWYDVIELEDRRAAMIVGDVEGHDMVAASVMGQLRHGLALLLTEGATPAEALERMNAYLVHSPISHTATVLIADVDADTGFVRVASAGHPAPLVVGDGRTRTVELKPGPPIGVPGSSFEETSFRLGRGSLVLFTDGLVERRDRDPDVGLEELLVAVERRSDCAPGALIHGVLDELLDEIRRSDDIAVLVAAWRTPEPV